MWCNLGSFDRVLVHQKGKSTHPGWLRRDGTPLLIAPAETKMLMGENLPVTVDEIIQIVTMICSPDYIKTENLLQCKLLGNPSQCKNYDINLHTSIYRDPSIGSRLPRPLPPVAHEAQLDYQHRFRYQSDVSLRYPSANV